ncbi:unnamed protein product, partial [Effrenium voratum]
MPKSKLQWRAFDEDSPPPVAEAETSPGVSLDAALAGFGVSRKACRQLRAELRLEEDSFQCLHHLWRLDARRVESALRRLPGAEAILQLLESEEPTPGEMGGSRTECGISEVAEAAPESASPVGLEEALPVRAGLSEVRSALPRMLPGTTALGREERSRALRRRLKAELPPAPQAALKAAAAKLREEGPSAAESYVTEVWKHLQLLETGVELMVGLVTSYERKMQLALRNVLARAASASACASAAAAAGGSRAGGAELFVLPEAFLLQ